MQLTYLVIFAQLWISKQPFLYINIEIICFQIIDFVPCEDDS